MGMCLSVRSSGSPDLSLHAPLGLMKMYEATNHFVRLYDFNVKYKNPEDGDFVDKVLTVKHVPLSSAKETSFVSPNPKYGKWGSDMELASGEVASPKIQINAKVFAYVVTINSKPGKINMAKCLELGLKPGPLIGMLQQGKTVSLDNGETVRPQQVRMEEEPSKTYLGKLLRLN